MLWDINLGAAYDLTSRAAQGVLRRIVLSAHYVHFGPPCNSFSLARRGQAPRSRQYPMGKPGLSESDQQRVRIGNTLLFFCCALMRVCSSKGILWSLEQPQSSRMWITRVMTRALRSTSARTVDTVYCRWGERWLKRTRFAFSGFSTLSNIEANCSCALGCCDFTGRHHIQLSGTAPGGTPWTQIAQPYPSALCSRIADLVSKHFIYIHINRLDFGFSGAAPDRKKPKS